MQRTSTRTKPPRRNQCNKKHSNDDPYSHPLRTLSRISDLREVLRGLGEHHAAGRASIEMRNEACAFVTELSIQEQARKLIAGQALNHSTRRRTQTRESMESPENGTGRDIG